MTNHGMTNDELPDSWLTCTLGEVTPYGSTKKVEPSDIPLDAWVLELEDIEKDTSRIIQRLTFRERKSRSTKNHFQVGDVLYGKLRPYLNKVVIADDSGYCTTEVIPLKSTAAVQSKYLFYWLKHPLFLEYVTDVSHGLNMPRLGTDAGKAAPFILAPLAEQKRIADKLEAVLERVDACRDRLDRLPVLLKRFRQSVLAAATSGSLTGEWRKDDVERVTVPLRDAIKTIRTGPFGSSLHKADYVSGGTPIVNPMHINGGKIYPADRMTVDDSTVERLVDFKISTGDVIIGRRGEMGRCAMVTQAENGWLCGTGSMVLTPSTELDPAYLQIFLSSPATVYSLVGESVGSTMVNLNQKILLDLEIFFPPLPEQQEIVRRVEDLFAFADRIEARLALAQKTVDRLTPSVLAKAFRGGLVTQDPTDEPASALLARLRSQPVAKPAKAKRIKHP
jgi:type I restriction enzyme S subunit